MSVKKIIRNNIHECDEFDMIQEDITNENGNSSTQRPHKRVRSYSDEQSIIQNCEENEFTLVQRKNKRIARQKRMEDCTYIEVCVTSDNLLPKQIGFAKLLKEQNIPNITQIKYRSPYKVTIKFECREDAEKLLMNTKIKEFGYRCRLTNEVSLVYGIVKYIELEINEDELIKSFKSDFEILSVKRLKRLDDNGQWIESETVRFCFQGGILPTYVYGYDCRFKVEPYTFPVTQCGICWKYGHLSRACTAKKPLCPKCAGEHQTCDTTIYRCMNCKGEHMAFYKKCPVFLKEKEIRRIMCINTCTYKVALSKYVEQNKMKQSNKNMEHKSTKMQVETDDYDVHKPKDREDEIQIDSSKEIDSGSENSEEILKSSEEETQSEDIIYEQTGNRKRRKIKMKKTYTNNKLLSAEKNKKFVNKKKTTSACKSNEKVNKNDKAKQNNKDQNSGSTHSDLWSRIQVLFFTDISFEQKFLQACKIILETIRCFFVKTVSQWDMFRNFFIPIVNG